nr:hypothetical protein [Tanacetum cinerariifolium]
AEHFDRSTRPDRQTGPNRTRPNVFQSGPRSRVLDQFGLWSGRSGPVLPKTRRLWRVGTDRTEDRPEPNSTISVWSLVWRFGPNRSRSSPVMAGPVWFSTDAHPYSIVLPLEPRKMPGRPRKKRIRSMGEGGSSTRVSKVLVGLEEVLEGLEADEVLLRQEVVLVGLEVMLVFQEELVVLVGQQVEDSIGLVVLVGQEVEVLVGLVVLVGQECFDDCLVFLTSFGGFLHLAFSMQLDVVVLVGALGLEFVLGFAPLESSLSQLFLVSDPLSLHLCMVDTCFLLDPPAPLPLDPLAPPNPLTPLPLDPLAPPDLSNPLLVDPLAPPTPLETLASPLDPLAPPLDPAAPHLPLYPLTPPLDPPTPSSLTRPL